MDENPIEEISQAIKNHTIWLENINKCLICDKEPNKTMIDTNAHLECKFGKWLEDNKEILKDINLKVYYEVYDEHQKLHAKGKEILDIAYEHNFMNVTKHKTVPEVKYNELLKLSKDIKKTLRKFRTNLYDSDSIKK